jgi:hypothetical protein
VSLNLREGTYRDLGLAQDADYYLAEAYRRLDKQPVKAEALYRKIALEAPAKSDARIDCLIQAASCRVLQAPKTKEEAHLIPAFWTQFAKDLTAIEQELLPDSDPDFRVRLVRLRFKLATTFAQQKVVVEPHLAALSGQKGEASTLAQCEILLNLAISSGERDAKTSERQDILVRCGKLIDQIADAEDRLTTQFQLLSLEQTLYMIAAEETDQEALTFGRAIKSLESAERALEVAAEVEKLQENVWCTPELKRQKFDTVKATLPIRKAALQPIAILFRNEVKYARELKDAQQKVYKWWQEVKLDELSASAGGPTDGEKKRFRQLVRP